MAYRTTSHLVGIRPRLSRIVAATILTLFALTSLVFACDDVDPANLIPAEGVCDGWTYASELETAYNYAELTEIINGGASLYMSYGFVAGAFQHYAGEPQGTATTISLNLFNQGSPENAAALYHDPEVAFGEPIADWPGSGEARQQALFGYVTVQFWEGCFYASLVMSPGDETTADHVSCLATETMMMIQAATASDSESWGKIKCSYRP